MQEAKPRNCDKIIALIGAPNTGKTTLFNVLTGSSELVANWPGATVAVKYAKLRLNGLEACLVDLPGTYSIHGTGPEEKVTRDFLLQREADAVIVLADSTNLERGLFLLLDVLELYPNTVLVLTKIDEARARGIEIDTQGLAKELGIPVIAVSAIKMEGIDNLKKTMADILEGRIKPNPLIRIIVPTEVQEQHKLLTRRLIEAGLSSSIAAWLAARLLEGAEWAPALLQRLLGDRAEEVEKLAEKLRRDLREKGVDPDTVFVTAKYEKASALYGKYVSVVEEAGEKAAAVGIGRVDRIFLHPILGPVASLASMFLIFLVTYVAATGSPLDIILEKLGFEHAAELVTTYSLVNIVATVMDHIASLAMSLIPDPVLARAIGEGVLSSSYGLGLVLSFMPLVAVLMFTIGVLEDSGLVPRIAAGVDRFFRKFGVSGKAVFPAMLSLGCNVPGVLASRVMDHEAERKAVIFAVPLIPCMARFTVLLALAHIFFGGGAYSAAAVFAVYMTAVILFLLTLRAARRLLHLPRSEDEYEFILELPPLKKPSLRVVWWLTWDKLKHFLVRAGTVIVVFSLILWFLANYGPGGYLGENGSPADSYAASVGHLLAPYISAVFGVDSDTAWRLGFAFLGGFVAKEVFLDAMAAVAPGNGGIASYNLSPAQVLAIMVAVTLYIPCIATVSAMYSESRDARLVALAVVYDTVLATAAALTVRLLSGL